MEVNSWCSSKMWLVQTSTTCCKSKTLVTKETFLIEDLTLGCVIYLRSTSKINFPKKVNFEVFHVNMPNISKWHSAILYKMCIQVHDVKQISLTSGHVIKKNQMISPIQRVSIFLVFYKKLSKDFLWKRSSYRLSLLPSYLTFIWYFWKVHRISPLVNVI